MGGELDGYRRALRQRLKGCVQALLGEDGGMDAPTQLSKLAQGLDQLLGRLREKLADVGPRRWW